MRRCKIPHCFCGSTAVQWEYFNKGDPAMKLLIASDLHGSAYN